ncbi:hypothetical protein ACMFMG_011834 [Clarireedia jacksonii]
MVDVHEETRQHQSGVGQGAVVGVFEHRAGIFADVDGVHAHHRGATRPGAGVGVDQGVQQHIFGTQHLCHQRTGMYFDHVRQGPQAAGEHRVHRAVFAGCRQPDRGPVFDPGAAICTGIGSPGERVFVCGQAGTVGGGAVEREVEPRHEEGVGGAVDDVRVAARRHWDCHAEVDAGEQDVGDGGGGGGGRRGVCGGG